MVRTKRPQWQPLACRRGASSGTVTGVARMSVIFMAIQRDKLTLSLRKVCLAEETVKNNRHPAPGARHQAPVQTILAPGTRYPAPVETLDPRPSTLDPR